MADAARKWTDAELIDIENHIRFIYQQAYDELSEKWNQYMKRGETRLENLYNAYVSAPINEKTNALKKYQDAVQNYTIRNRWFEDMVNVTAFRLANVNQIALDYVNGKIPNIYVHNFNFIDPELRDIGIRWTLRDEHMVRNLMRDSLPQKTLNVEKDMLWNKQQINSAVLQGIIQGESIPKISKRIFPLIHDPNETDQGIIHKNTVASIRNARTMVTGAENKGRIDRYHEYEDKGVVMKKVWIATPDGRTRAWHLDMDGQEVGINKMFIDGHGNELEYPGDPGAAPETVYNCRCSMRTHLIGIKKNGRVEKFKDFRTSTTSLHQEQIAAEKENRNK